MIANLRRDVERCEAKTQRLCLEVASLPALRIASESGSGRVVEARESRKGGRGMRERWLGPVLVGVVFVAVFWGLLWLLFSFVERLPVVHRSWSSQECVEVFSKDPAHDCHNLPPKYSNVWVQ